MSLCSACTFAGEAVGRLGQRYVLCRNDAIASKYPYQPVLACPGYDPVDAQSTMLTRRHASGTNQMANAIVPPTARTVVGATDVATTAAST